MDILKISFLIIGSIIGAGFASGKEVFEYFAVYGYSCLYLLPLIFLLFFVCIFLLLKIGQKTKIKYINNINKKLFNNKKTINYFTFITFLILSSAMFSGLYNLLIINLPNINKPLIYLFCLIVTIILSNINYNFFKYFSLIIVPIIITFILINNILTINSFNCNICSFCSVGFIFMPFLYVFQNVFLSSFIIIKSGAELSNRKCILVSIFTSIVLTLLIGLSCYALLISNFGESEMPFIESSMYFGTDFKIAFSLVMLFAIITTFITTLSTLKEYFNGDKFYKKQYVMIILIAILGSFDLSFIIKYLYPIIGCIGFVYHCKCFEFLRKTKVKTNKTERHTNFSFKHF